MKTSYTDMFYGLPEEWLDRARTLDLDHIEAAAKEVDHELRCGHSSMVEIQPGDATRYIIIVGLHESGRLWFASSFGRAYPLPGWPLHHGYVTDKYVSDGNRHTGMVFTIFLNAFWRLQAEDHEHKEG